ncbi:pilus (MSHA type) biogenesis protein MshL [Ramlibacter sp.]|uniref:pilus (MSHA type) biogenesis protein MshL n=1 Tax=Ramlibacter sp. TaxID=1917967 RepID=UPI0035AE2F6A
MIRSRFAIPLLAAGLLAACAAPPPQPSAGHLAVAPQPPAPAPAAASAAGIPRLSTEAPPLPPPRAAPPLETYSVVVHNVPVQSLLFAIARDARLNLDVHPDITGVVTLNALDQTIHEILDRVARQVDMRWELSGQNLLVLPDTPFLRLYRVDYPNVARESSSTTSSESQVATTGQASAATAGNASSAVVRNVSNNRFWDTLVANVRDLLRETDRVIPEGASAAPQAVPATPVPSVGGRTPTSTLTAAVNAAAAGAPAGGARAQFREAASVIANPETGVLSVRATARQHQRVREFIDQVLRNSRRQVLIEATIVEVGLTQEYQQGINWSVLRNSVSGNTDVSLVQAPGGGTAISSGLVQPFLGQLSFLRRGSNFDLSSTVRLLESFGRTRVLSSPKVSVMNNQSALLKVVDNKVYFTISVTPATFVAGVQTSPAVYSTQVNTVPVGFLMNVTAQVGDDDTVTLNLRPTVSRITGYVSDPSPALAQAGVTNRIPEIQTREFESIMKVRDGEVAVLGGLMQDDTNNASDQLPGAGSLPVLGDLFRYRNERTTKSELVIFLRPTILRDASIDGDLSFMRQPGPAQGQGAR